MSRKMGTALKEGGSDDRVEVRDAPGGHRMVGGNRRGQGLTSDSTEDEGGAGSVGRNTSMSSVAEGPGQGEAGFRPEGSTLSPGAGFSDLEGLTSPQEVLPVPSPKRQQTPESNHKEACGGQWAGLGTQGW